MKKAVQDYIADKDTHGVTEVALMLVGKALRELKIKRVIGRPLLWHGALGLSKDTMKRTGAAGGDGTPPGDKQDDLPTIPRFQERVRIADGPDGRGIFKKRDKLTQSEYLNAAITAGSSAAPRPVRKDQLPAPGISARPQEFRECASGGELRSEKTGPFLNRATNGAAPG